MKVVFVHGALVFDGAWWWHRMVETPCRTRHATQAVELPAASPRRCLPLRPWRTCTLTPTRCALRSGRRNL